MKKIVGSFVGVASISTFIVFPAMVQANINSSSSNSSSRSLFSQNTPETTSPSGGTTSPPRTTTPNRSLTALDKEFMTKAAQSDQTEIQTSQLALKRSQNQEVKNYAQRMIKEHTDSSQQLKQIAKKKSFTLPKDIGPENKALLTKLTKLNGKMFDQAYMEGQLQAHTKTLADYQNYLTQGQDSELNAFASKIAPIVADHLQMVQNMVTGTGTSSTDTNGTSTPSPGTSGSGR
ncbi:DUF4142 domain-containing protein [Brasilonema sp. UFV-L1]|nr:DUF4142 domain-containing protein [Brasilonema sp. UFV-L1]NMG05562.1 DUF4142 domain-containing protein [Brasilonema sp. UFV-L1]